MIRLWNTFWRLACHPAALVMVSLLGALLAFKLENARETVPFALALTASVVGLIFLLSNRAAFSIYAGWMIVGLATAISAIKFKMKGFSLHGYDAVFFAQDRDVVHFLIGSYLHLVAPIAVAITAIIAVTWILLGKSGASSWHVRTRALLVAVTGMSMVVTFPSEASKERFHYYMQGRHVSAFFISLLDMGKLFSESRLEARLQSVPKQQPFPAAAECGPSVARPDVFVVLSESQIDPAIFPQLASGQGFLSRHAPAAGPAHPLTVETFGGGTWITNLSLMSGLSAVDFGWQSPYLTMLLQDRIGGALPQVLAACGYRTVALLPMKHGFVNEGPFLRSIGFETILDMDAIKAPNYHMRDNFYFDAAERFIDEHRKTDGRPLFLEIQTMFPHSPYNERLEHGIKLAGEPFSPDPETNEYLRRSALSRIDFQSFLEARADKDSARGSVVLEFGDHQSFVTQSLAEEAAGGDAIATPGSLAFRTFYTMTSFGPAQLAPAPDHAVDIAYLGTTFASAAGLPMSAMMQDMMRLRDHCKGLFHACADRAAIDAHLRRRVDSGLFRMEYDTSDSAIATQ